MSDKSSEPADDLQKKFREALEKKNAHHNAHPGSGARASAKRTTTSRSASSGASPAAE